MPTSTSNQQYVLKNGDLYVIHPETGGAVQVVLPAPSATPMLVALDSPNTTDLRTIAEIVSAAAAKWSNTSSASDAIASRLVAPSGESAAKLALDIRQVCRDSDARLQTIATSLTYLNTPIAQTVYGISQEITALKVLVDSIKTTVQATSASVAAATTSQASIQLLTTSSNTAIASMQTTVAAMKVEIDKLYKPDRIELVNDYTMATGVRNLSRVNIPANAYGLIIQLYGSAANAGMNSSSWQFFLYTSDGSDAANDHVIGSQPFFNEGRYVQNRPTLRQAIKPDLTAGDWPLPFSDFFYVTYGGYRQESTGILFSPTYGCKQFSAYLGTATGSIGLKLFALFKGGSA